MMMLMMMLMMMAWADLHQHAADPSPGEADEGG
jgi:hypothetical protein